MKATAVIGANFGDEGKGLMTDYFCVDSKTLVVRFNGGAQSGHTVVTPEGHRHVFSHFGSGTFIGAATFLSSYFLVNPFLWKKELMSLRAKGLKPKLLFSLGCSLTLPYDMLINQELERSRGSSRHGSCGVGINETMTRKEKGLSTSVEIVNSLTRENIKKSYLDIRDNYFRNRIEELNLKPNEKFFEIFNSDSLLEKFLDLLDEFTNINTALYQHDAVDYTKSDNVVFEGAQGLLLDQNHFFFPHVTHSNTGLKNVITIAKDLDITGVNAIYVTRSYMTRHGAGPFPTEDKNLSYKDTTNVPHEFQGHLRFGNIDPMFLGQTIQDDMHKAKVLANDLELETFRIIPQLAITCLDQVGSSKKNPDNGLIEKISYYCPGQQVYMSHGPTRNDVSLWRSSPRLDFSAENVARILPS